jgi:iron complex transport system permease protein
LIASARAAPLLAALRRPAGARLAILAMGGALGLCVIVAVRAGAMPLSTGQVLGIVLERAGISSPWAFDAQQASVVWAIRIPRVLLGALIGSALGVSGAAMQGLFRNPLADPALLGVSSGASLGAVAAIAFGASLLGRLAPFAGAWLLPAMAFTGGVIATCLSVWIGRVEGRTRTALMLLAGVAINALAGAGIGLAMHVVNDAQLRSLTFWTLGSLGGATWHLLAVTAPLLLVSLLGLTRIGRPLNALLLGEREAMHLGVPIERTQRTVVLLTALGVGASVAVAGVIGFVGLVVPHLVRALLGPDHRRLLLASALVGAALLSMADVLARTLVAPAELPVGVVTAAIGAPLFLWQLARERGAGIDR